MKRVVVDCEDELHSRIVSYSRKSERSIQGFVRFVLLEYMRQNPIYEEKLDG